jgi:hypothetical protein
MGTVAVRLVFPELDAATAHQLAQELRSALLNARAVDEAEVVKVRDDTADLGTAVELLVGLPVLRKVADDVSSALARWFDRRREQSELPVVEIVGPADVRRIEATTGDMTSSVRDAMLGAVEGLT